MFRRARKRKEKHIAPQLLSAYLDGQVTPQECARVEQHLRACEACTRELETLRYTTRLLCAAPRVSVPHAFTLSEADVNRTAARRRARRPSLYLQGATALVAALLLVVVVGDALLGPIRYGAPQPMVMEKAIVETVVVEMDREVGLEVVKEGHAVEKVVEAEKPAKVQKEVEKEVVVEKPIPVPSTPAPLEADAPQPVEKPTGAEVQALAITPKGEPQVLLEAQSRAGWQAPAAEPTVAPLRVEEALEETAAPPAPAKPAITPSPEARPSETAAPLAVAPTPAPTPTPLPQLTPPETAARPATWRSMLRLAEIVLASLLVLLLGLSLRVSRRR